MPMRRGGLIHAHISLFSLSGTLPRVVITSALKSKQQIPVVIVLARRPGCRVGVNAVTQAFSKPDLLHHPLKSTHTLT